MATIRYEAPTARILMSTASSALTTGAATDGNTDFNNAVSTELNLMGDLDLAVTFGTGPTAGLNIECYLVYDLAGSSSWGTRQTSPKPAHLHVANFLVSTSTSQRIQARNIPLSPAPIRAYLINETNQSMSSGWSLTLYPYRLQSA